MFKFFKKEKEIPNFNFITTHPKKAFYFSRVKKWDWLNKEEIFLSEKDSNDKIKMTTLDFWSQEMFLDADGQKTVEEYLGVLIKQFQENKMKIPADLDEFMIGILDSLHDDLNAIVFSTSPIKLDPEFDKPLSNKT
jgi:hypothetical protein